MCNSDGILKSFSIKAFDDKYRNTVLCKSKGNFYYNADERRFLDCSSTMLMANFGHNVSQFNSAIVDQLNRLSCSSSFLLLSNVSVELAKRLTEFTNNDFSKFYFSSSGSDAVETALELALSTNKSVNSENVILTLEGCYHGSTVLTKLLSINDSHIRFSNDYNVIVKQIPINTESIDESIETVKEFCRNANVVCIITEIVQLSNYCKVIPKDFFIRLNNLKNEYDFLWINDEIATGLGRTCLPFAYMHLGVVPDMITIGKAFGGGYSSFSSVCMSNDIYKDVESILFEHGFTTSALPIACRAAIESVKYYENYVNKEKLNNVSQYIIEQLRIISKEFNIVRGYAGMGMMFSIKLSRKSMPEKKIPNTAYYLNTLLMNKGILMYSDDNDNLIFAPPLNITINECKFAFNMIKKCIYIVEHV